MKLTNDIAPGYYFIWNGHRHENGTIQWSTGRPGLIYITDVTTYRRKPTRLLMEKEQGGRSYPLGEMFLNEIRYQAVYELSPITIPERPL